MIDTIVLALSPEMYSINNPDKFEPSAQWALDKPRYVTFGIQSKQNPTKKELHNGVYKPRLTLSNRFTGIGRQIMLKIELSLPKLLFGNNFNELQYKDLKKILEKLSNILDKMGITISAKVLANAPVSAIHYSKNIVLTDGSTPYSYIQKIKEANVKLSLDVNQTDYRNEGHSYKWHSNWFEVVFYDKIKDLSQAKISSKKSLEKDSDLQLDLFKSLSNRNKLEVLRFEVRLNKKDKIKRLFNRLKIKSDLTLQKLFKPAISKKILLYYLDELERKRPLLLDYKVVNGKALLADLIFNNPKLSPRQIILLYGLKNIFDIINPRELRTMFSKYNKRGWYRLIADANKVNLPAGQNPFKFIREQLVQFKPVTSF